MSFLFFFYANPFGFINLQCVLLNMSCMADLQTLSKKKAFINAAVKTCECTLGILSIFTCFILAPVC